MGLTPGQSAPDGSYTTGNTSGSDDWNESSIRSVVKAAPLGAFEDAEDELDGQVKIPLNGKPDIEDVPIGSALWHSMNYAEQATFPRSQLAMISNTSTGSGGGSGGSHSHSVGIKVPDYQPAGNGADLIEIGYIRVTRTCSFNKVGFITGDSATWAGITAAYLGIYKMQSNGDLVLLNTSSATADIKSSITTANSEHIFGLGITVNALQNDVYAIGLLQDTGAFQTCASIAVTRTVDPDRDTAGVYPSRQYGFVDGFSTLPASISEASIDYSASEKLPFYYIREI